MARTIDIETQDDEAYLKCLSLLMSNFQSEENAYNKKAKRVKVELQTAQEHNSIIEIEKQDKIKSNTKLEQEVRELESEIESIKKGQSKKQQIKQKIKLINEEIKIGEERIQECKLRSYDQKDAFVEIQTIQFDLNQKIQQYEDEQKLYYQFKARQERYRQLCKIRQKLYNKIEQNNKQAQSSLEQRINQISGLRTHLVGMDEVLLNIEAKIEEQNFVITALKEKSRREASSENDLFQRYKHRYQQLYMSNDDNLTNWKNYKTYLEDVLKRRKVDKHLKSPKYSKYLTQPADNDEVEGQFVTSRFANMTPKSEKRSEKSGQQKIKFPKIIRMSGGKKEEANIKENLKTNLKNMINESDISLQSIGSDEQVSGQFIEVEFHKNK